MLRKLKKKISIKWHRHLNIYETFNTTGTIISLKDERFLFSRLTSRSSLWKGRYAKAKIKNEVSHSFWGRLSTTEHTLTAVSTECVFQCTLISRAQKVSFDSCPLRRISVLKHVIKALVFKYSVWCLPKKSIKGHKSKLPHILKSTLNFKKLLKLRELASPSFAGSCNLYHFWLFHGSSYLLLWRDFQCLFILFNAFIQHQSSETTWDWKCCDQSTLSNFRNTEMLLGSSQKQLAYLPTQSD